MLPDGDGSDPAGDGPAEVSPSAASVRDSHFAEEQSDDRRDEDDPDVVRTLYGGIFVLNFFVRAASVASHVISRSAPVRNRSSQIGGNAEKSIV
jgi:hypothetical protein